MAQLLRIRSGTLFDSRRPHGLESLASLALAQVRGSRLNARIAEDGQFTVNCPIMPTILMLQNVAVIHVRILLGRRMIETHDDRKRTMISDESSSSNHDHVFPALLIR